MTKLLTQWPPKHSSFVDCVFCKKGLSSRWHGQVAALVVFLFLTLPAWAQSTRTISGTVVDVNSIGLPGVSVVLKGTTVGTATDGSGKFSIPVPEAGGTLQITYIGYLNQEIPLTTQTNVNVVLREDAKALDEVVVVGYGTQNRREITGSVSSVNMEQTRSLPVPDAGQALQGRAAGVQVVGSGAPGSNVTIRVRGTGTIGNSDPLIVIDGVPTDLPLNAINPDDIATMDILKDASATAIYGSRGANGVVQITTRRGTDKGRLEFKAYTAVQQATNMVEMLNSAQFAALHNEIMANNGQLQNPAYADPASITTNTDWLGEYFQSAPQQNYSLSYSGGTEKSNFYTSGTYTDQQGIVINNRYKRYTLTLNSENNFVKWFKLSNNLLLSHDKKSSGSIDIRNAMAALPVQPIYNPDGTWSGPEGQSSWYGDVRNPIGQALINDNTTSGYNVLGNLSGEFLILPQLTFKTTLGIQAAFWDSRSWSPQYAWKPIANEFSTLYQGSNRSITKLWDNYLTYDATFGGKHHLTILAGTSAQDNRYDQINATGQDFISDDAQQLDNATLTLPSGGNASDWALFSLLGRVNYNYNDKYLLTANIRRDGSSRFGPNNRYGTFPSASAKWRISEEGFLKEIGWLSDLSLRVGYGITGNQNIGNYAYASRLSIGEATFNNTVVNSVVPVVLPNADVRWEEVEQSNIGLDVAFLNGRVNVTVDAYLKNTNDMLVPMNVPVTTGYSDIFVPSINFGKVRNKGLEFAVNTQNLTGAIDWSTNFNFSINQNEVLNLNGDVPLYGGIGQINRQKVGYPINSFYGFVMNGIFQTQEEVDNYARQQQGADPFNSTAPGDVKFLDINNDGQITDADRTYIGDPNPRFTFAMNNTVAWKGFDLTLFLQGVEGNDIFNANRIFQEGMAVAQNQTTAVLGRWTESNPSAIMPRAVFNDPNKNTRNSTRFMEDGSYLRVKNVTLGYTLPQSLTQKVKMSSARIYVSGQNLFTFTDYTGFDPEVGTSGVDLSVYPLARTLSAGINIGF
ncbi:SusC/RagA family TonB-linked outer membrane protein [Rufibacter hautae]|uniref:TonB-dependent receptor n=1 Tax=Rufibacter hautae TaxID=2595005 RepID=A0A5B6TI06_9BACT|nr:TonB-dependent receptor [Rufibacter hautae]KAA3439893.1 TonB-dependent receptor [Rufibacter hautae]